MRKTIIVGAGPAGLTAGKYLKDCLILEQQKEIGKPVQCGEAISKESLDEQGIEADSSWISAIVNTVQIIAPSGRVINVRGKRLGFMLDRPLFEKFLASQCRAEIKLATKIIDIELENDIWKVKTNKGEVFESKYLIGADGPLSIVRRKVFKEKVEILPAIDYLVELEKEIDTKTLRMYFDYEKLPNGYAWIFPKSKKTANIGLGGEGNLGERFKDFLERTVKKEFGSYKILENKSGTISWGGAKIKLFKDNAFLTGDAGGLVDPIFGGGMSNAMISGRVAAKCILSDRADLYESKIKSMPAFSPDLLLAQKILYSLPNPVLNQLAEILEKKDIFYVKTIPGILKLFLKPHLRGNVFKLLKLFLILQKNTASFG